MIPLSTTDWSAFALIINTGISISKAICSKSLKPSMSGMCTSDKTMSNSSFFVRKYSNAVTEDVVDVTVDGVARCIRIRKGQFGEKKISQRSSPFSPERIKRENG